MSNKEFNYDENPEEIFENLDIDSPSETPCAPIQTENAAAVTYAEVVKVFQSPMELLYYIETAKQASDRKTEVTDYEVPSLTIYDLFGMDEFPVGYAKGMLIRDGGKRRRPDEFIITIASASNTHPTAYLAVKLETNN